MKGRLIRGMTMRSIRLLRAAFLSTSCAILAACGDSTAPVSQAVSLDSLLSESNAGQSGVAGAAPFVGAFFPAGTIIMDMSAGTGMPTTHATITYNGTSTVTMTFGTMTCTIDLANPSPTNTCK